MGHGKPSLGSRWSGNFIESFAGDLLSSTMEEEPGWAFLDDFGFE